MPRVTRVADRQPAEHVAQRGDEPVGDVVVSDHPAQGRAALAGGSRCGEDDSPLGELEIGRWCHDRRVVPAELEQRSPHAGRHAWRDLRPHALRTGGADKRDIGAVNQRLALASVSDHEPLHICRRAALRSGAIHQGRARHRGQRGHRRGLPHDGVSADKGDRGVPRPHRRREVERGDDADHAQRVPRLHQPVAWPLGRHRAPIELARQPDREVADIDGLLHLAEGLRRDLPGLDRDQVGDVRLVFAQQLAQTLDERAPDRRRYATPLTKSTSRSRRLPPPPRPGLRRVHRTTPRP